MRSRLKRDRRAMKIARYVKRCEKIAGDSYTGVGRWGMASYRALSWFSTRKVKATWNDVRAYDQVRRVDRMFYNN